MQVPAFLLRRLYVKGSLRHTGDGFAFSLKNTLGSGYAEAVLPLLVDGHAIPQSSTAFSVDGQRTRFDEVSAERPFTLAMDRDLAVEVDGWALAPGPHSISLGFMVTGMGELRFEVTDELAEPGNA